MNWASFSIDPNVLLLETSALLMSSHSLGFPALHLLICPFHTSLSLILAFHLFANSLPLSSQMIPAHPWRLPGPPSLVACSILEMQPFTPFSEVSVFPPIMPVTQNYNYLHARLSLEPELQEGSHHILSSVAVPVHSTAQLLPLCVLESCWVPCCRPGAHVVRTQLQSSQGVPVRLCRKSCSMSLSVAYRWPFSPCLFQWPPSVPTCVQIIL